MHRDCGTKYFHAAYFVITQHVRQGIPFKWCCADCSEAAMLYVSKGGQQQPVLESTRLDSGMMTRANHKYLDNNEIGTWSYVAYSARYSL